MKLVFVDTNVILRLLLKDIPDQYMKARNLFSQASKYRVICVPEVIAEVIFVLKSVYKIPKKEIAETVKTFLQTVPADVRNKKLLEWVLDHYQTTNFAYVDLLISGYALEEEGEVFSFDKKLMNYQKRIIK